MRVHVPKVLCESVAVGVVKAEADAVLARDVPRESAAVRVVEAETIYRVPVCDVLRERARCETEKKEAVRIRNLQSLKNGSGVGRGARQAAWISNSQVQVSRSHDIYTN